MFTSFTQYDTNRQTETGTVKSMRELGGGGGVSIKAQLKMVLISYINAIFCILSPPPPPPSSLQFVSNSTNIVVRGQFFKDRLMLTLGQNLTHFFSLCTSTSQFLSKHEIRELQLAQIIFLKKYFSSL